MANPNCKFVWYELMTTEPKSAEAFYASVAGWRAADAGMAQPYTILSAGEAPVGGLMALPDEVKAAGGRPGWIGYVGVPDVDAYAARVAQRGGALHRPAADIPGVGRFAVVADPFGAAFCLFKGNSTPPPSLAPGHPGSVGWHELQPGDGQAAFAFYADMFGWAKAEAMDMGANGVYQIFSIDGVPSGGIMNRMPEVPASFWLYYINVAAIDAAVTRVNQGGGKVINGPMEVPGGSWIVQCLDPQGAMFALVGPKA